MQNGTDNGEIDALLTTGETAWLGATDAAADASYEWDAGTNNSDTALTYDNFGGTSTNSTVDCALIADGGGWTETDCTSTVVTGYVYEVP